MNRPRCGATLRGSGLGHLTDEAENNRRTEHASEEDQGGVRRRRRPSHVPPEGLTRRCSLEPMTQEWSGWVQRVRGRSSWSSRPWPMTCCTGRVASSPRAPPYRSFSPKLVEATGRYTSRSCRSICEASQERRRYPVKPRAASRNICTWMHTRVTRKSAVGVRR